jgi:steroid delta-isomerase-like uncharacterized protein
MSTETNKAIIRRYIEDVWGKGDFAADQEVVATDLVDHNPVPGWPSDLEGHHQVLVIFRNAFPDLQITLEDVIAEGDKVVDRWTMRATHSGPFMNIPPTGKQVTLTGMDITRIENGKIVELWHQEDMLGLLQQLGVIPAPGQAS